MREVVQQLKVRFPSSSIVLRDLPFTKDSRGDWYLQGKAPRHQLFHSVSKVDSGLRSKNPILPLERSPFHDQRVHDINTIISSLAQSEQLSLFPFGKLLIGQLEHYQDKIHPGKRGASSSVCMCQLVPYSLLTAKGCSAHRSSSQLSVQQHVIRVSSINPVTSANTR